MIDSNVYYNTKNLRYIYIYRGRRERKMSIYTSLPSL